MASVITKDFKECLDIQKKLFLPMINEDTHTILGSHCRVLTSTQFAKALAGHVNWDLPPPSPSDRPATRSSPRQSPAKGAPEEAGTTEEKEDSEKEQEKEEEQREEESDGGNGNDDSAESLLVQKWDLDAPWHMRTGVSKGKGTNAVGATKGHKTGPYTATQLLQHIIDQTVGGLTVDASTTVIVHK